MKFREIKEDKRKFMKLLLLADEQESMVEKYLESGRMFVLEYGGQTIAECVVTKINESTIEIKNIAVSPRFQRKGFGKKLIEFIEEKFKDDFKTLRVGTGESPLTLPFYKKCGFCEKGRIENFFTDNYDHEIIECGVKLKDMVILEKTF